MHSSCLEQTELAFCGSSSESHTHLLISPMRCYIEWLTTLPVPVIILHRLQFIAAQKCCFSAPVNPAALIVVMIDFVILKQLRTMPDMRQVKMPNLSRFSCS